MLVGPIVKAKSDLEILIFSLSSRTQTGILFVFHLELRLASVQPRSRLEESLPRPLSSRLSSSPALAEPARVPPRAGSKPRAAGACRDSEVSSFERIFWRCLCRNGFGNTRKSLSGLWETRLTFIFLWFLILPNDEGQK